MNIKGKRKKKGKLTASGKKKVKILVASVAIAAAGITGGIFAYVHYENTRPVGNTEVVSKGQKDNNSSTDNFHYGKLVDNAIPKKENRNWKYLFEARIDPIKHNKKEFSGSDTFLRNLMTFMQSGETKSDINQAAALWTRNSNNYNFTNDDNLVVAGVGKDILAYDNYLDKTKGLSIGGALSADKAFGDYMKREFKTPMSMIVIGSQLRPAVTTSLVLDENSAVPVNGLYGTHYIKNTQISSLKDAKEKGIPVYVKGKGDQKVNKAIDAWNYLGKDTHSVYQVETSAPDGVQQMVSYVIEDGAGRLKLYGFYFKNNINSESFKEYRESQKQYPDDEVKDSDITWKSFLDATK